MNPAEQDPLATPFKPAPGSPPGYLLPLGKLVRSQASVEGHTAHAAIMHELEKLLAPKQNWGSAILVFVVTLLLFVGAGGFHWNWELALLLVPILLFHELGHYLAMLVFRYRNLRMFFIPLLGAAVSGQHFNVAGWKKAVVSLMGPVPGVAVGAGLTVANILSPHEMLGKVASLTLILNGFNLLPLLPLDGGWLLNAVLFCRNRWVEATFKAVTALGLIGVAFALQSKLLLLPGFLMLFSTSFTFKVGTIAQKLQREGVAATTTPDGAPDAAIVDRIVTEVRSSMPAQLKPQAMAGMTLQVFEKMNARPPGVLASLGLLGVYGGSFLAALVFASLAFYPKMLKAQLKPSMVYTGNYVTQGEISQDAGFDRMLTLIVHHSKAETARTTFNNVLRIARPDESVTLFGQSVFITGVDVSAARRKEWKTALRQGRGRVIVERHGTNQTSYVNLKCKFSDTAKARELAKTLSNHFSNAEEFHLPPPWADRSRLTEQEREQYRRAWNTYQSLLQLDREIATNQRLREAGEGLSEAFRQCDTNRIDAINKDQARVRKELRNTAVGRLLSGETNGVDRAFVELYEQQPALTDHHPVQADFKRHREDYQRWAAQVGLRMGGLPATNGFPTGKEAWVLTRSAFAFASGSTVHLERLSFLRTDTGLPALANWLRAQGATDIRYAIPDAARMARFEE